MKTLLLLLVVFVQGCMGYRVVCVYTNWSQYRPDGGKFLPEDVDASLCTHLIYVYAKLKGNKLEPTEWNDEGSAWSEGMYDRVNNLKQLQPELKTLLGVGGWMMGSKDFSKLASSRIGRKIFAKTSAKFLRDKNFDGLSIDWQHPTKRGGKPTDKVNFSLLLQEIRKAFEAESKKSGLPTLLLTAGVSASREVIDDGYEIDNLTKYTDFLNVMAYDLHGAWDNYTGHPSQLYAREEEFGPSTEVNVDAAMRYWITNVPDRTKLNLGVSTYGRTFTLRKARHNDYNVPTTGPGVAGEFTQQPGMLAYYERCSQYADAKRVWDAASQVAYWYSGKQWIAGEDIDSVKAKVNWTRTYDIGGMMIWSLDTDDFLNICLSQEYPLLNTLVTGLNDPSFVRPNVTLTRQIAKLDPKTTKMANDIKKGDLKKSEDIKFLVSNETSDQVTTKPHTTTTTMQTTAIAKSKPVINHEENSNKSQNVKKKTSAKKEQQLNEKQQLSTPKPSTMKTANKKQVKKIGRRRRIDPRRRRKMVTKRRQQNGKLVGKSRQRKGPIMKRKVGKEPNETLQQSAKGKNNPSFRKKLSNTTIAGKGEDNRVHSENEVESKFSGNNKTVISQEIVVEALGEKTNNMTGIAVGKTDHKKSTKDMAEANVKQAKEANSTKTFKDSTDRISQIIVTNDIIVKNGIELRQDGPQKEAISKKKQASVTIGKTLRIARKKDAQAIVVRRKTKEIQKKAPPKIAGKQKRSNSMNKAKTTTPQTDLHHSQETNKFAETDHKISSKVKTFSSKENDMKRKGNKTLKKKIKWRRRKVSKNGKRRNVRRRRKNRKQSQQKSNSTL